MGFWRGFGSGFLFFFILPIVFFEFVIFFELFIEFVLIKVLVIKILITLLSSRSDHLRCSLLSDLRLLLRRLRFLLG